ncbi:hypothetical protein AMTR_s00038p00211700 [Amborella trichopoda]|uniref:Uncharacterized protein n=1 Tax=Amborella trichopoda TaxID=13333 RepID=U5CXI6_AMBTC|nr:hypothetical protein AMTR_s00038p00211700 [Amborella trichopoda]
MAKDVPSLEVIWIPYDDYFDLKRTEIMGLLSIRLLCVTHTLYVKTFIRGASQIVCSSKLDFTKGYLLIPCGGRGGKEGERDLINGQMSFEPRDINHAAQVVHECYNSRNWDLVKEALQLLKSYDPEAVGDEDAYEELELDDEMEDNIPPVWLPSRPDEEPRNTQSIPTLVQPEESR